MGFAPLGWVLWPLQAMHALSFAAAHVGAMLWRDINALRSPGALESAALSDVGLRRGNNQDSYAVVLAADDADWRRRGHLFLVADGMGAHAAGELASKMASESIGHAYRKLLDRQPVDALTAQELEAAEPRDVVERRQGLAHDGFAARARARRCTPRTRRRARAR